MTRPSWDERIQRAEHLAKSLPFAAELLTFYAQVAAFQKKLHAHIASSCGSAPSLGPEVWLQDRLDLLLLLPDFPDFLLLMSKVGPPAVAQVAEGLARDAPSRWEKLLTDCWRRSAESGATAPETLLALAYLQPYAEYLAEHAQVPSEEPGRPTCPRCDAAPIVGVLRPEGHGARRSLVCSVCATEWEYLRIVCPACGEDRFESLSVYIADEFEHVRVEACESCKTYIKTVDLSKNGLAVPVVDELATVPLNLWAQEKGYTKLQANLLGL